MFYLILCIPLVFILMSLLTIVAAIQSIFEKE